MDSKQKPVTIMESYKAAQTVAGENSPEYKKSMLLFVAAFTAEGLAYLCFFPLLACLSDAKPLIGSAALWLCVMFVMVVLELYFRWRGHDFDFKGTIVDVAHRLRLNLGEKLKVMPQERLYSYKTGTLNNIFSVGVEYCVLSMGIVSSVIIQTVIPPVLLIVVTFFIEWRLAVAMLVLFCIAVPVQKWQRSGSSKGKKACGLALARVESDVLEYVQGLPVLRSANQTGERSASLQSALQNHRNVQTKVALEIVAPMVLMAGIVEIGLLAVLTMGVFLITKGSLTLSVAAALLVIISRFSEPLSLFSSLTQVFDIVDAALVRITELLSIKPLEVSSEPTVPGQFDIEFKQVSFAYAGQDQYALQDVSFFIPAGKLTALVGPSGSGKTTITKLIMRYADPRKGTVKIGGIDLRQIRQEDLMKNVSVVFQDVYLFDDTILNNIRMGNPDASDEQVRAAAQKAFCHEFIDRLPNGYNTVVGDIGGALSGGEKQRISIARAILKDAAIVMLDEPTAALDTQSEVAVQKAINTLVADKTVIVIAHRLSTIAGADNILVVENGTIAEQGTHTQLMTLQKRYASMWDAQQRTKQWNIAAA
ncbi:ABC transporter ATP-binding protein [uncultured Desulfobacter sp.]|uniref:ABC transporter ATP-binding protein n=1 Tax=uncultured Desulfobacter sp. TaxID=240139 RepID=UPI002AAA6721|nr:ABC transporter ATP-binding protein [uncultured Desulfobacter sp.]